MAGEPFSKIEDAVVVFFKSRQMPLAALTELLRFKCPKESQKSDLQVRERLCHLRITRPMLSNVMDEKGLWNKGIADAWLRNQELSDIDDLTSVGPGEGDVIKKVLCISKFVYFLAQTNCISSMVRRGTRKYRGLASARQDEPAATYLALWRRQGNSA